jgi:diaminopimelate epimerase
MARRIIYCFSCNTKYDVSAVSPGARFLCKTCQTPIKVPDSGDDVAPPPALGSVLPAEELEILPEDLVIDETSGPQDWTGLSFTKLVGTGNDFVLVDGMREPVDDPETLARMLCDRRFGVGSDGLLLLMPSEQADLRMRMFNPDGSEAEACGNGLRCLVKYAFDHGHVAGETATVETMAGLRVAEVRRSGEIVDTVRVGMGEPSTAPADIPARVREDEVLEAPLKAGGHTLAATLVSMGNPHAVIFVDDVDAVDVDALGPAVETLDLFPNRTNVEFVQVISPTLVRQRTWERGAGETLACGSGACAVCVAGSLRGKTQRDVTVRLRGGDLKIDWTESGEVFLEGPAVELFTGLWCSA